MPHPSGFRGALLACLLLCLSPLAAQAHGSVAIEDDLCAIQIGYFRAHFKIYLPRERRHDEFCEDLPATGEGIFVMEYIHRGLGEIPIEFRIIRNVTGMGQFARWADVQTIEDLEPETVFHSPPAIVPDVFTAMFQFDEPGEYIGIVTATPADGGEPYTAVFPFEVGFTGFGYWPLFLAIIVALQLNYLYMRGWLGGRRESHIRPAALVLGLLFASPAVNADPDVWTSRDGLYRLSFASELEPVPINRMHRWTLILETADGQPVDGAEFEVIGGMPMHDHGLPTEPQVTRELGDGRYALEGVRFHMNGYWEITVSIDAAPGRDTVVIKLDL